MKNKILVLCLLSLTSVTQAGSIYKCTQKNAEVIFTDKPCATEMKQDIIHKQTPEEARAKILREKLKKIRRLIRTGKSEVAQAYAQKQGLEEAYQQAVATHSLNLEQQLKQQALETKKQELLFKQQQLLIQQRSIELQKQQLEQQKQQTEAAQALVEKKEKRRNYFFYPYTRKPRRTCFEFGVIKKCNQPRYYWGVDYRHKQSKQIKTKRLQKKSAFKNKAGKPLE